ncbi:hypothetical protein B0H14DRAFT_3532147 [Mycena olivaceomarginata]|nr:hypothetical protein B0H14DRAFT_3532147 [Mycena olivaceomarginata]
MSAFNITGMLNPPLTSSPDPPHPPAQRVDASSDLRLLFSAVSRMCTHEGPLLVTPTTQLQLQNVISSLSHYTPVDTLPRALPAPPPPPPPATPHQPPTVARTAEYGARISPRSRLSILYRYEPGVDLEYPQSGVDVPVGHLIPVNPSARRLLWTDIAYSCSEPDGGTRSGEYFYTHLLVDRHGVPVPCEKQHSTCQGIKACPHSDTQALAGPLHWHTSATRQDVEHCLAAARDARQQFTSPQCDTFLKTAAYIGVCDAGR